MWMSTCAQVGNEWSSGFTEVQPAEPGKVESIWDTIFTGDLQEPFTIMVRTKDDSELDLIKSACEEWESAPEHVCDEVDSALCCALN